MNHLSVVGVGVFVGIPHWFLWPISLSLSPFLSSSLPLSLSVGEPPAVLIISLFSRPADKPAQECLKLYNISLFFLPLLPCIPSLVILFLPYLTPTVALMGAGLRFQEETCQRTARTHVHTHTQDFKMLMFDSALIFSSTSILICCQFGLHFDRITCRDVVGELKVAQLWSPVRDDHKAAKINRNRVHVRV